MSVADDPASIPTVDSQYISTALSSLANEPGQAGHLSRRKLGCRKASDVISVPRDNPQVKLGKEEEKFDEDDARTMSPRRTSKVVKKPSQELREALIQQTKGLQGSLLGIVDRVRVSETRKREDRSGDPMFAMALHILAGV